MTDLKDYCLTCGKHTLNPGGFHSCHENPVITHLKNRITELEAQATRDLKFISSLNDECDAMKARIAELEAIEAQRMKPCVWTTAEGPGWNTDHCTWSGYIPKFCHDCGHPVVAKEEK